MPESGRGSKAGEGGEPKGGKEGGKEEGGSLKAQDSFLKFQAHFLSSKCTFTIQFWFWCSHFGVPNSQGRSHFVVFKDVLDNFPKDPRTMVSQHFHNDKGPPVSWLLRNSEVHTTHHFCTLLLANSQQNLFNHPLYPPCKRKPHLTFSHHHLTLLHLLNHAPLQELEELEARKESLPVSRGAV